MRLKIYYWYSMILLLLSIRSICNSDFNLLNVFIFIVATGSLYSTINKMIIIKK